MILLDIKLIFNLLNSYLLSVNIVARTIFIHIILKLNRLNYNNKTALL